MAATGIEEDALTARLRGVLDKAQQVQASIAVLEKDHKTPTDVLEKLNVLAGTEVARLLSEVNPILKHYVARPGNGNVSHAALMPVLLRTKHEPEVEDEDRAADEVFEQTVDLGSDERRDGASQAVLKSLQARAAQHDEMMQAVTAYATQALASVDKWDARSSSARLSSGVKSVPSPQERQEAAAAFAALYGGV